MSSSFPRAGLWAGGVDKLPAADAAAFARRVEDAGIHAMWIAEGLGRDSLVASAMLLSATEQLNVGTSVSVTWNRSPILMVGGQQALSEWFPERFTLGIGVSHGPMNAMRRLEYVKPYEHLVTYLDEMAAVPFGGVPAAATRTLLGAQGPRMLALAAERLDGAIPYLTTPAHTAQARAILGPDKFLVPEQGIVFSRDADDARAIVRQSLVHYRNLPNYRNSWLRQGFDEADLDGEGSDRLIDGLVAWGDDDVLVGRIRAHLDAGADHVQVQVIHPGGPANPATFAPETVRRVAEIIAAC